MNYHYYLSYQYRTDKGVRLESREITLSHPIVVIGTIEGLETCLTDEGKTDAHVIAFSLFHPATATAVTR